MGANDGFISRVREFAHRHLLGLVVAAYALAAVWPAPGEAVRGATVARISAGDGETAVTVQVLLLAALLFATGLSADAADLAGVARRPAAVLTAVAATVAVPLAALAALAAALGWWHDPGEARAVLLGLGVVAAMPVAGSSAAWSQQAGGSPALSLGLVVASTLLSPVTTPLALAVVGPLAGASAVETLSGVGPVVTLLVGVVAPAAAGMAVRGGLGRRRVAAALPAVKLVNVGVLVTLCYANASASLPGVAAEPDWDFLALVVGSAAVLCAAGFAAGWGVARAVRAGGPQTRSLVFGLGMTNNGTGLVVAGTALAGVPAAVVPVLAYNLIQHLVAGVVNRAVRR